MRNGLKGDGQAVLMRDGEAIKGDGEAVRSDERALMGDRVC